MGSDQGASRPEVRGKQQRIMAHIDAIREELYQLDQMQQEAKMTAGAFDDMEKSAGVIHQLAAQVRDLAFNLGRDFARLKELALTPPLVLGGGFKLTVRLVRTSPDEGEENERQ